MNWARKSVAQVLKHIHYSMTIKTGATGAQLWTYEHKPDKWLLTFLNSRTKTSATSSIMLLQTFQPPCQAIPTSLILNILKLTPHDKLQWIFSFEFQWTETSKTSWLKRWNSRRFFFHAQLGGSSKTPQKGQILASFLLFTKRSLFYFSELLNPKFILSFIILFYH